MSRVAVVGSCWSNICDRWFAESSCCGWNEITFGGGFERDMPGIVVWQREPGESTQQ
ncbi:MAG TPA: hypothetical protein VMJ75_17530 [Candidatus Acidoferrales bacterium]|nr:hypothetical protein [Candidatus Acidoferrales bacterium]